MRFGLCTGSVAEARRALAAGFDYVEMPATGFCGDSESWNPLVYHGLNVETTNLFFPREVELFAEPPIDFMPYVARTLERATAKGVRLMVVGSGGSRRMDPAAARYASRDRAFVELVVRIAERAGSITIAPESLNRSETNVGNDMGTLAKMLEGTGAGYTVDAYHVLYEWDADGRKCELDDLWREQIPYAPSHVHLADLPRHAPKPDDPMLVAFANRLRDLGYDGRISLECRRDENTKLGPIRRDMKELFDW